MNPEEDDDDLVGSDYGEEGDPELSSEDLYALRARKRPRKKEADPWLLEARSLQLTGDPVRDNETQKQKRALLEQAHAVESTLTLLERDGEAHWLRKR